jgi:uncharacterized protein (DUF2235 family)
MKRLVCSLDGTWNDDDGASPLTNVAKLHRAIPFEDSNGVHQFVRYVVGVASLQDEGLAFLKGALGFGIGDRIKAAFQFLSHLYEPGDEIYLFGFSRGAYEARSLASFITLFGLSRQGTHFPIDEAWTIYRQAERKRDFDAVAEISALCHYPVRIRCLGVWDTVGNIGNPYWSLAWLSRKFDHHDTRLHDTIDVALHALSIDEARSPFRPTLFTYPDDMRPPSRQHIEQTWFAGTHADVGGGWPETALSDIPLLWMAERIEAMTDLAIDVEKLRRETNPDHLGLQHDSSSRFAPFVRVIHPNVDVAEDLPDRDHDSRADRRLVSLNETVHQSALMRLGQPVTVARAGSVHEIIYEPRSLSDIAKDRSSSLREENIADASKSEAA